MSKLIQWLNSVGIRDQKAKNQLKICLFWPNIDLILSLEIWMPTEFGHLANFDISNVYMNVKCLIWGVTILLRTIFNLEQCDITVVEPYQLLCYGSNFSKLLFTGWNMLRRNAMIFILPYSRNSKFWVGKNKW